MRDNKDITNIDDLKDENPIFITLAKSAPIIKSLLPYDSMIALADHEKFIYVNQGETVNSFRYRGDPIPCESGLYQCQQTGTTIIMSLPKEVYGAPAKTTSVPIKDEGSNVIGAISLGVLGYIYETGTIIAESKIMQKVLHLAYKVAQVDSTVLLSGESGTGKEVIADYIHRHSKRPKGAFIAVNCASLPEHLIESELFGYKRGAFTGATMDKVGLFEAAGGGTLFLDEIGELPFALQSKLLRVLETGKVRRVGSTNDFKVDFRLMVATHRNLKEMVDEGKFREDLYYRLNVIPIQIPPLRDRPEDIVLLARKFHDDSCRKYDVNFELDIQTINSFLQYNWPGNVRELRNHIERRIITGTKDSSDALASDRLSINNCFNMLGLSGNLNDVMDKLEELYIGVVLEKCKGRIGEAAKELAISRMGLYKKMKRLKNKHK
jgi:transcriptional regulator with PAS, ATPase and Fis domain